MTEHGLPNFALDLPDFLGDEFSSSGDETLTTVDMENYHIIEPVDFNASSSAMNDEELHSLLTSLTDDSTLPPPEMPCTQKNPKRFKTMTKEDMEKLFQAREAPSTKKNTQWGVKIFQDWNIEKKGIMMDLKSVLVEELAESLGQFYCEAKPASSKTPENDDPARVYHRTTIINIRAAINRHLSNLKRNVDIVRDKEFKLANGVLDGMLKERMRLGLSKPVNHKKIIEESDLQKISTYLKGAAASPIILRECVWYHLSINFISRGMEFHHQLKLDSFEFHSDDSGEYATIKHETKQKNFQGGLSSKECNSDKRMYATHSDDCPLRMLRLFIEKTDKTAQSLFNQYNRDALACPLLSDVWFTSKSLSKRTFARFLPDICKAAHVESHYTPHCLRATSIQHLNDENFETRHIMFMSNHKNEASLRSYNRTVSTSQKKL